MESSIIIGIIIILALLPIVEKLYKKFRGTLDSEPDRQIADFTEEEFGRELAKALGTDALNAEDSHFYLNFHGGVFWFRIDKENNRMSITFPGIADLKHTETAKAYKIANYLNSNAWWTVYIVPTPDNEKPMRADCCFVYMLQGSFARCVECLRELLDHPFYITRKFNDILYDRKLEEDTEMLCLENDVVHKIYYDQYNRAQVKEGNTEESIINDIHTISWLLTTSSDIDSGCVERMRIIIDNEVETLDNVGEITSFNIKSFIISHLHRDNLTLIIDFERGALLIHINKTKGNDAKHLLYRMTVTQHCTTAMPPDSIVSYTTLLAINLTTDSEESWEAKYMIEEGAIPNSIKGLDEETQKDYYWGMKLYNSGCNLQALQYLKQVYNNLTNPGDNNYDGVYSIVCFVIGSIYTQLNMHDTAYLYLETMAIKNKIINPNCCLEFVHCLSKLNTPDAIGQILQIQADLYERAEELQKEGEEENERALNDIWQTRFHINRILVTELIKRKKYDKATTVLNNMIELGNDVEFAQDMLNYIKHLGGLDEN